MERAIEHRPPAAIAQVAAVAAVYIAISIAAVGLLDLSSLFAEAWAPDEKATGGGFLTGAVVQIALVLAGAYLFGLEDLRLAIGKTFAPANRGAWTVAGIATAIHIGTALLVFLPQPGRALEPSAVNLILSAVPAADGWSQEVLFRGYVLFRLARAGVPALAQILVSGALFAAIHIGYAGGGPWGMLAPLVGTFMLGCFYAWAVQIGRGSLKPVIVCHVLIIVVLQPWLALAR
jgi:hypothetical protein